MVGYLILNQWRLTKQVAVVALRSLLNDLTKYNTRVYSLLSAVYELALFVALKLINRGLLFQNKFFLEFESLETNYW